VFRECITTLPTTEGTNNRQAYFTAAHLYTAGRCGWNFDDSFSIEDFLELWQLSIIWVLHYEQRFKLFDWYMPLCGVNTE
jgi:hypothetical protein